MKILRQKLFTFQDKIAWEELKNATNNFKDLPQGRKGMKPRDVFRLQDLAELEKLKSRINNSSQKQ